MFTKKSTLSRFDCIKSRLLVRCQSTQSAWCRNWRVWVGRTRHSRATIHSGVSSASASAWSWAIWRMMRRDWSCFRSTFSPRSPLWIGSSLKWAHGADTTIMMMILGSYFKSSHLKLTDLLKTGVASNTISSIYQTVNMDRCRLVPCRRRWWRHWLSVNLPLNIRIKLHSK